jgi:glycosyltransferase involved in cell wall biosynthesis
MVSAGFWPAVGGAERQALELSRALRARGVGVVVLTRRLGDLPGREEVAGVPVRRLPVYGTGIFDSLSFLIGALGWLLKHAGEYDAIHAHLAGSPALAAALAGRFLGKPVLVKLGGGRGIGELATSAQTVFGRLKLRILSLLKPRFLAVVPDLANEALEYLGAADIEVVPNGVDVERFKPVSAEEKLALRARLGWPAGKIFLYTGRLSWEKRLSWFIKLWEEAAAGRDATLILVGEGPERFLLQGEATSSNGRIRILPAANEIADLYAAADAFVLPSISEGLSNSLLEAMSSGLPVIASAVGGNAETIENGRTGLLFSRDDAAEAMSCVQRVLDDPELGESLGAQARNECETTYSLARVARHCEELYSLEAI